MLPCCVYWGTDSTVPVSHDACVRLGRAVAVLLLPLLLVVAAPADAKTRERVDRQEYFLPELLPDCDLDFIARIPSVPPVPANKGGACFRIRANYEAVNVTITDDTGMPVSGVPVPKWQGIQRCKRRLLRIFHATHA